MPLPASPAVATRPSTKLTPSVASTKNQVQEVQRLRYKVFIEAAGLTSLANPDGLERDEFDHFCDHLLVRGPDTLKVVRANCLQSPDAAGKFERYCSENEFDLSRLNHLRGRMVEAGCAS